jgi:hypothetical protein
MSARIELEAESLWDLMQDLRQLFYSHHHPHPKPLAEVSVAAGSTRFTFQGDFTMRVPDTGGPFTVDITAFLDAKGNPATDTDAPVFNTSDASIATVSVGDPNKPQEATVTLTGKTGQAQITADFAGGAAAAASGGFTVTGLLEVQPGAAVSATMTFSGPGISAPGP